MLLQGKFIYFLSLSVPRRFCLTAFCALNRIYFPCVFDLFIVTRYGVMGVKFVREG